MTEIEIEKVYDSFCDWYNDDGSYDKYHMNKTKELIDEQIKKALEDANIKDICTSFFYHWYNAKGNNTEQGFDEWWKTRESINKLKGLKLSSRGNVLVDQSNKSDKENAINNLKKG